MNALLEWLKEARPEIIGGLVLALLGWLWNLLHKHNKEEKPQNEVQQQEQERIKAIRRQPPMSDDDFLKLCKSGNAKKVEEAIINGANVNAKDNDPWTDGWTALMWAAMSGKIEVVEFLIRHGATVNARDHEGRTALMFATINRKRQTADLLRSYGAKE